jgi:gamma-glutamylcyclotransferase (GGCT)/AIG2-like uncharacterized protein YtfP
MRFVPHMIEDYRMYYFAYGSNMSHRQMADRCKKTVFVKRVFLADHRFVYDGYSKCREGAVANVVKQCGNRVWGGLFEITLGDLRNLDIHEGYPKIYQRREEAVQDEDGNTYPAILYYRTGEEQGGPSPKYRQVIVEGAHDCGIDAAYIRDVIEA